MLLSETIDKSIMNQTELSKNIGRNGKCTTETIKVWKKEPVNNRSGNDIIKLSEIYNIPVYKLMGIEKEKV